MLHDEGSLVNAAYFRYIGKPFHYPLSQWECSHLQKEKDVFIHPCIFALRRQTYVNLEKKTRSIE